MKSGIRWKIYGVYEKVKGESPKLFKIQLFSSLAEEEDNLKYNSKNQKKTKKTPNEQYKTAPKFEKLR